MRFVFIDWFKRKQDDLEEYKFPCHGLLYVQDYRLI